MAERGDDSMKQRVFDGMEYEFSIDGSSGAIMGWESEPIHR